MKLYLHLLITLGLVFSIPPYGNNSYAKNSYGFSKSSSVSKSSKKIKLNRRIKLGDYVLSVKQIKKLTPQQQLAYFYSLNALLTIAELYQNRRRGIGYKSAQLKDSINPASLKKYVSKTISRFKSAGIVPQAYAGQSKVVRVMRGLRPVAGDKAFFGSSTQKEIDKIVNNYIHYVNSQPSQNNKKSKSASSQSDKESVRAEEVDTASLFLYLSLFPVAKAEEGNKRSEEYVCDQVKNMNTSEKAECLRGYLVCNQGNDYVESRYPCYSSVIKDLMIKVRDRHLKEISDAEIIIKAKVEEKIKIVKIGGPGVGTAKKELLEAQKAAAVVRGAASRAREFGRNAIGSVSRGDGGKRVSKEIAEALKKAQKAAGIPIETSNETIESATSEEEEEEPPVKKAKPVKEHEGICIFGGHISEYKTYGTGTEAKIYCIRPNEKIKEDKENCPDKDNKKQFPCHDYGLRNSFLSSDLTSLAQDASGGLIEEDGELKSITPQPSNRAGSFSKILCVPEESLKNLTVRCAEALGKWLKDHTPVSLSSEEYTKMAKKLWTYLAAFYLEGKQGEFRSAGESLKSYCLGPGLRKQEQECKAITGVIDVLCKFIGSAGGTEICPPVRVSEVLLLQNTGATEESTDNPGTE